MLARFDKSIKKGCTSKIKFTVSQAKINCSSLIISTALSQNTSQDPFVFIIYHHKLGGVAFKIEIP